MGIPDLVEAGPKFAEELAKETGRPQALYRLMRATASVEGTCQGPDGKFSETRMSAVLRSNARPSLRALAIMGGREWHGRGWSAPEYCVRTGKQALDHIYGMPAFEYLEAASRGSADFRRRHDWDIHRPIALRDGRGRIILSAFVPSST